MVTCTEWSKPRFPLDILQQATVETEPPTLASLVTQLRKDFREACRPSNPWWSRSLRELFHWIEEHIEVQTVHMQFSSQSWIFRHDKMGSSQSSQDLAAVSTDDFLGYLARTDEAGLAGVALDRDPHFAKLHVNEKHMLFVSIPLALYVRNTPHLYEITSRMRGMRLDAHADLPEDARSLEMLEVLDSGDGTPFSCLVFFLIAALQVLYTVCLKHGRGNRKAHLAGQDAAVDLRSLLPLSGSAPEGVLPVDLTGSLLFRGLWVPDVIDEEAARLQWTFNSFSRYPCGALHVLNFYASSHTKVAHLANTHRHVLLLIMRRFDKITTSTPQRQDWAFPVQFFNGLNGRVEQEFILPPFVEYTFEEDLEIHSSLPEEEQARALCGCHVTHRICFYCLCGHCYQ